MAKIVSIEKQHLLFYYINCVFCTKEILKLFLQIFIMVTDSE
jgi:hypothetical protein